MTLKNLKTAYVMINLHLYVISYYRWGTRRIWVWRMKIFLMKINVHACTLENSLHLYSSVSGELKLPLVSYPGKFSPGKFPPGILPPMFLNIPTRVFNVF